MIKLFSEARNAVPHHIICNNFDYVQKGNYGYNGQQHFTDHKGILIDIGPYGTYLKVNPTKYLKGTNLIQLAFSELPEFVQSFVNHLEIHSAAFRVTGYDTAIDLFLDRRCAIYLPIFRELRNYSKIIHRTNSGITFRSENYGCERLYDKLEECRVNHIDVPPDLGDKNLFRIEQSVKKIVGSSRGKIITD